MSVSGIHRGTLRKYGGFVFKQWKERYLVLTADGSLLMCRDAVTPPHHMVALQRGPGGCQAVVEGREILDLPRLPPGGRRDCCFALILPLHRFLLLMADTPQDCSQWLKMLRKVRESVSSPLLPSCRGLQTQSPQTTEWEPPPEPVTEGETQTPPPASDQGAELPHPITRTHATQKETGKKPSLSRRSQRAVRPSSCLRHGAGYDTPAVRAVYLLMGGAAASSAMGYLGAAAPSNMDARVPHLPLQASTAGFSELDSGGAHHHACSQMVDDSPANFHSFDFEAGGSDFDSFDCGGFTF